MSMSICPCVINPCEPLKTSASHTDASLRGTPWSFQQVIQQPVRIGRWSSQLSNRGRMSENTSVSCFGVPLPLLPLHCQSFAWEQTGGLWAFGPSNTAAPSMKWSRLLLTFADRQRPGFHCTEDAMTLLPLSTSACGASCPKMIHDAGPHKLEPHSSFASRFVTEDFRLPPHPVAAHAAHRARRPRAGRAAPRLLRRLGPKDRGAAAGAAPRGSCTYGPIHSLPTSYPPPVRRGRCGEHGAETSSSLSLQHSHNTFQLSRSPLVHDNDHLCWPGSEFLTLGALSCAVLGRKTRAYEAVAGPKKEAHQWAAGRRRVRRARELHARPACNGTSQATV